MTDHSREPMDPFESRLARDLRAASSVALRSIDAGAQARAAADARPGVMWPWRRSMSPALVIAAVAAALALIAALAMVGSSPRLLVETPTVHPSAPAFVQVASPSPTGSPRACMTDTVQVLTGAAMDPISTAPPSLPELGTGQGVFTTTAPGAKISEIWSVGNGRATPMRIGEIRGGGDVLDVVGLSPDATEALIRIANISPSGATPECGDLYLAATDGSGSRRLTHFTTGSAVVGGAISPDGTRVAYATWTEVGVLDLTTGATLREPGCPTSYVIPPVPVIWSSAIDRFAVGCDNAVVYDPTGTTSPIGVVADDTQIGIGWSGATLMVGRSGNGPHQNGFHVDAVDPRSGHTVRGPEMANTSIDWVIGSGDFSPGGQQLIVEGYVGTDDALYLVDANGAAPRKVAPNPVGGSPFNVSWSIDGRSVEFANVGQYPTVTLTRVDVATAKQTDLGRLSTDYSAGAWRIP